MRTKSWMILFLVISIDVISWAAEEPQILVDESTQASIRGPNGEVANSSRKTHFIKHPDAAKGLARITADGTYLYRVERKTIHKYSGILKIGMIQSPAIGGYISGTDFKSMYSSGNLIQTQFDYEWQLWSGIGKLGVQFGIGVFTAQGSGYFASGSIARESYTFTAIPLSLGGVYRLELSPKQWVAPYVAGGGVLYALLEKRDDTTMPGTAYSYGVYGAGGLMLNIANMSREAAFVLDSEYGIANLWATVEFRRIQGLRKDIDMTTNFISGGVSVDF